MTANTVKEYCNQSAKKATELCKPIMTCGDVQEYLERDRNELANFIGQLEGTITTEDRSLLDYTYRFILIVLLNRLSSADGIDNK